jgi:hypothetical protein
MHFGAFASRRKIALLVGSSGLAGLIILGGLLLPQPRFEGKTLGSWLSEAAYSHNYATTKRAVQFFKRTGSRAVPGLIPIIKPKGFTVVAWLKGQTWLFSHLSSGVQKRVNERIQQELELRAFAIELCGIIGPSARATEAALLRSCADPNPRIRAAAADALTGIHAEAALAVPTLLRMLGDKDTNVRGIAAMELGRFGPAAKSAVPALQNARNDPDAGVASLAHGALLQIEQPELIANARQLRPISESHLGSVSNEMRNFSSRLSGASRLSYDGSP